MTELLSDWGAFLDVQLSAEAIMHSQGGPEQAVKLIEIVSNGHVLGTERVHLLTSEISISLSSITDTMTSYEKRLRRSLHHTPWRATHWIDFSRQQILMKTLMK